MSDQNRDGVWQSIVDQVQNFETFGNDEYARKNAILQDMALMAGLLVTAENTRELNENHTNPPAE